MISGLLLAVLLQFPNDGTCAADGLSGCYRTCTNGTFQYCYDPGVSVCQACCSSQPNPTDAQFQCVSSGLTITCTWPGQSGSIYSQQIKVDGLPTYATSITGTSSYVYTASANNQLHDFQYWYQTWDYSCINYGNLSYNRWSGKVYVSSGPTPVSLSMAAMGYSGSDPAFVTLTYAGGAGTSSVDIYQQPAGSGTWALVSAGASSTTANISGTPGASYSYKVLGRSTPNGYAASYSSPVTVTMPYPQPTLALAGTGYRSVSWSWIPPSPMPAGGVTYLPNLTGFGIVTVYGGGTTYTYPGGGVYGTPADNTQYCLTVTTRDSLGQNSGRPSNSICGTTAPGIPDGQTTVVTLPAPRQIRLTWTNMPGATSYDVYRNGSVIASSVSPGSGTSTYLDSATLADGTSYTYNLVAKSASGQSPQSTNIVATTLAATGAAPTLLGGTGTMSVSWPAASGATSYDVYRVRSDGGATALTFLVNVFSAEYLDTGLVDGAKYRYAYTPKVGATAGTQSNYSEAYTAPAAVTSLSASNGQYKNTITFTTPADVSGVGPVSYEIYWSSTGAANTWAMVQTEGAHTGSTVVNVDVSVATGCFHSYWAVSPRSPSVGVYVGAARSAIDLVVDAHTTPGAPVGFTVVNNAGYAELSWTSPADAWCAAGQAYSRSDSAASPTTYTETLIAMAASPFLNNGVNDAITIGSTPAGAGTFHSYVMYFNSPYGYSPNSDIQSNVPALPTMMRMRVGQ
jgi:fibronectin type 3 domain-containing protein